MRRKIISLLLATLLLVALFSACGTGSGKETGAGEDDKYAVAYGKYKPDTQVLSINGTPIYWEEFFYWIHGNMSQIENSYGEITDWEEKPEGQELSYNDMVFDYMTSALKQYNFIESEIAANKITLNDEDKAKLDEQRKSDVESYGQLPEGTDETALSEDEIFALKEKSFSEFLDGLYLSQKTYDKMNSSALLSEKLFTELYGEKGAKIEDAAALKYAEDNGYVAAKHILFETTVDETGEEFQDLDAIELAEKKLEILKEKKRQAEETLATLKATSAENLQAKFDELMNELSEDPGLETNPNGYCYASGTMQTAFESAAAEVQPGELVPNLVETPNGYHIILRLPVTADMTGMSGQTASPLKEWVANGRLDEMAAAYMDSAEIVYMPDFENVTIASLFS